MQWYYVLNSARLGPVTQEQFDQLVQTGAITNETLVWRAGMSAWMPLSQAFAPPDPRYAQPAPDADSAICAVSGKVYPKRDMLEYNGQWISAEHKDDFFQRLREGVPLQGEMRYVGFWFRFLAWFIDGLCFGVVNLLIGVVFLILMYAFGAGTIDPVTYDPATKHTAVGSIYIMLTIFRGAVQIACAIGYDVFFIRKFDATPGKLAIGVKIVRSDGSKLSVGRIIGRNFAKMVSAFTFCIGYMLAGWTSQKCALHDFICDTRVIKK